MNVAVVGVGFMGSNHVRVLDRIRREGLIDIEIKYIVDIDYSRAKKISRAYGGEPLEKIEDIRGEVDVAIVATPTKIHYETIVKLVEKNVGFMIVEKPLVADIREAVQLLETIEKNDVEISVGFIERFNPAVVGLMNEIESRGVRYILTVFSRRCGPFSPRVRDTDVTLDLGSHEIDIHLLINKTLPRRVRAYGLLGVVSSMVDHAWIHMDFGETISLIETSRLSPVKFRELYVTTKNSLYTLNYIEQKLEIKDSLYEVSVKVKKEEPLYIEDLVNILHYKETGEALVDVYQAFTIQLLCHLAKLSIVEGKDMEIREIGEHEELVEEGLVRMRGFYVKLTKLLEKFGLT